MSPSTQYPVSREAFVEPWLCLLGTGNRVLDTDSPVTKVIVRPFAISYSHLCEAALSCGGEAK